MIAKLRAGLVFASLATALAFAGAPANAEVSMFKINLTAAGEVPPTTSKGTGTVDADYDSTTKKLTWTITYSGLTGPATAAHFHSPAAPGVNAPPTIPLTGSLTSPIKGEATLTDAQAKDLLAGMMYFNIHTAANPGGEIRGQVVVPVKK